MDETRTMTNITFKSFWLSCMVTLVIFSFGALGSNKLHAKNLTKKVQISGNKIAVANALSPMARPANAPAVLFT
jgi:hypothetical protein